MPVTAATVDLERLDKRYSALRLRLAGLQGQARELQARQSTLVRDISLAKARIELAPEAAEVFNYLQEKAHAKAVGQFEDLLTAFVSDVIPDAGSIHLELGTERGAPALDIMVNNGGDMEDILYGNGGGLTNVVVTGLGYSALARTNNRQLMLQDEPDCWLKSVNVPAFTKVIAEVANPRREDDGTFIPGCQTLMVSHNDISLMDEGAHIQDLRIERDLTAFAARHGVDVVPVGDVTDCAYVVWVAGKAGKRASIEVRYRPAGEGDDEKNALTKGFPYLEPIGGARAWESEEQVGIRWIEAINLRTHICTRMELSSGLNVLTGPVNAGKSNLYFAALRAMAYGESDDSMIRHGADECIIRMCLEDGVVLEMVRTRKGAPKVLYRRYASLADFKAGNAAHQGPQERKSTAPSFITDVLRIERVDGMDIQLRSQKQPVFLLDDSPARRAQLLSVGRESGLLQALIERHRLQNRRDKEQVKRDEVELALLNRTLTVMSPLAGMSGLTDILTGLFDEAKEAQACVTALRALLAKMAPLHQKTVLFGYVEAQLTATMVVPTCVDTKPLASLVARVARSHHAAQLPDMPAAPAVPSLVSVAPLSRVLDRLAAGQHVARIAALLPDAPVTPQLADVTTLSRLLSRLTSGAQMAQLAEHLPASPAVPAIKDTSPLRRDGVTLAKGAENLTELAAAEKQLVAEERAADEALHALKDELGICPVCNKAFKEEQHA